MSPTPDAPNRCSTPAAIVAVKGAARFTKTERLRRRQEFLRVQAQGKRLHTRHFGVTLAPGPENFPRLGLVVTRRLGKAVKRNRIKRLLREFFRRHKQHLPPDDLVIMAKKGAAELAYAQVEQELSRLLLAGGKRRPRRGPVDTGGR